MHNKLAEIAEERKNVCIESMAAIKLAARIFRLCYRNKSQSLTHTYGELFLSLLIYLEIVVHCRNREKKKNKEAFSTISPPFYQWQ